MQAKDVQGPAREARPRTIVRRHQLAVFLLGSAVSGSAVTAVLDGIVTTPMILAPTARS
jgi:hypothetical protein